MSMRKTKVLGFDGWTLGVKNYTRLLPAFSRQNIDMMLIHLGSWGDDKDRMLEESIDGLSVKDIAYYSGMTFRDILIMESPDLVIFLSCHTFLHRAFQRYCHDLGIPTLYLAHGIIGVINYRGGDAVRKYVLAARMDWLKQRFLRSFKYAIPIYAKALIDTHARLSEWKRFGKDIFAQVLQKDRHQYAADAKPTMACVYVESEVDDACIRYGLAKDNIAIVGNPDLIKYGITETDLGSAFRRMESRLTNIMYIQGGSIHYYSNIDDWMLFIGEITQTLKSLGFNLIFKSKPRGDNYDLAARKIRDEIGVRVILDDTFTDELRDCVACITEPSSLGLIPAFFGMPLLLNRIPPLQHLPFGDIFLSYPRALGLTDPSQCEALLREEGRLANEENVLEWIHQYAGPMPPEEMPSRVSKVVLNIVGNSGGMIKRS